MAATPATVAAPSDAGGSECNARAAAAGQHHAADSETFGQLVQHHPGKDQPAERTRKGKSTGDGDAVKKGMRSQTECHGVSGRAVKKFLGMGFLAKVKVRDQGMLQQMNSAEASENP